MRHDDGSDFDGTDYDPGDDETGDGGYEDDPADLAYMAELVRLEQAGERTTVAMGPYSAMTIIGLLQFATRHPQMDPRMRRLAREFVRQLEPLFAGTRGEEIIRKGGHPEWDV